MARLPAWAQTLAVLGGGGGDRRWRPLPACGPLFRAIARTRLREIFTAAALLLVIGIALLMTRSACRPALGTFLAGVVLANSEYRHELESDIEPFKGLLLGLFFIAVGASIDFALIVARPLLDRRAGARRSSRSSSPCSSALGAGVPASAPTRALLVAFALPQVGEFAFVLFSFATRQGVLGPADDRPAGRGRSRSRWR